MANSMTVRDFEQAVLDIEKVVLVIRAPANQKIKPYLYERKCSGSTTVNDWLSTRVRPALVDPDDEDQKFEHFIIRGDYTNTPHGGTSMERLRSSYTAQ